MILMEEEVDASIMRVKIMGYEDQFLVTLL